MVKLEVLPIWELFLGGYESEPATILSAATPEGGIHARVSVPSG